MKKMRFIFASALLCTALLVSCSDDDKKDGGEGNPPDTSELHPSLKGSNYYLLSLDDISAEKIKDRIVKDYRPDGEKYEMAVWGDTHEEGICRGSNFYGEMRGWRSYSVRGEAPWSAVAFHCLDVTKAGYDFSGIDASYTLHLAIKSEDVKTHGFRFFNSANTPFGFSLGAAEIQGEGLPLFSNFTRNGEWQEIEIPLKTLIDRGWSYKGPFTSGEGNLMVILSGGDAGTKLEIDALFFYKK